MIDPEFCFVGLREFDYGVLIAHLALAEHPRAATERVWAAVRGQRLDEHLMLGLAGVEIMRRLIGVAQLPVAYGLDTKRRLLELSRRLVLSSGRGLEWP